MSSLRIFSKMFVLQRASKKLLWVFEKNRSYFSNLKKYYHGIPFLDMYERTTGKSVAGDFRDQLKKKHPKLEYLSHDHLQCTLQILQKFEISAEDACSDMHIFSMNPITMDNYGEILKECGFYKILPKHIIRYHTLVRSRTVTRLKKQGLLKEDLNLEEALLSYLQWPDTQKTLNGFSESDSTILSIRMSILERYLNWRLSVTAEQFALYIKNYLPFKHKPFTDIQEALDIAQNEIHLDENVIKKNGFIISSDPVNTKLIIENVKNLAGYDIREAIRKEPAILKNNYNALLKIRDLLEEYRIPEEAQRRCLKVYCMCAKTVRERLEDLRNLKEYQIMKDNPRVLSMVVHQRKMLSRLEAIEGAKKQCFSLNHLVASSKVFNNYISSFGDKVCSRDLSVLISSSLELKSVLNESNETLIKKAVLKLLKRQKFWLHSALHVVDANIQFLKRRFPNDVIFNNCQLLLYPALEIEEYVNVLLNLRNEASINVSKSVNLDSNYNSLRYRDLSDDQILSLVVYEIEKKYHFSGDGIWARHEGAKVDSRSH